MSSDARSETRERGDEGVKVSVDAPGEPSSGRSEEATPTDKIQNQEKNQLPQPQSKPEDGSRSETRGSDRRDTPQTTEPDKPDSSREDTSSGASLVPVRRPIRNRRSSLSQVSFPNDRRLDVRERRFSTSVVDRQADTDDAEGKRKPIAFSPATYKTEICRSHLATGFCEYGLYCQFAHGIHELRPRDFDVKYKTKLCKNYHEQGHCRFSSRCKFIHDESRIQVGDNEFWLVSPTDNLVRVEIANSAERRQQLQSLIQTPPSQSRGVQAASSSPSSATSASARGPLTPPSVPISTAPPMPNSPLVYPIPPGMPFVPSSPMMASIPAFAFPPNAYMFGPPLPVPPPSFPYERDEESEEDRSELAEQPATGSANAIPQPATTEPQNQTAEQSASEEAPQPSSQTEAISGELEHLSLSESKDTSGEEPSQEPKEYVSVVAHPIPGSPALFYATPAGIFPSPLLAPSLPPPQFGGRTPRSTPATSITSIPLSTLPPSAINVLTPPVVNRSLTQPQTSSAM